MTFFRHEASSGIILLCFAILALILANTSAASLYNQVLNTKIALGPASLHLDLSVLYWINDALMAVFFFVIGLDGPADLDTVTADLAAHEPGPGYDVVVDLQPDQDPDVWLDRGASWVLTRIGPYDLDLDEVRRLVRAGPRPA